MTPVIPQGLTGRSVPSLLGAVASPLLPVRQWSGLSLSGFLRLALQVGDA